MRTFSAYYNAGLQPANFVFYHTYGDAIGFYNPALQAEDGAFKAI